MIATRQMPRAAAVLLAVGVCVLPPRADAAIPRPDLRTAALIPLSASIGPSQSALHSSSLAAVLTLSEAAVSELPEDKAPAMPMGGGMGGMGGMDF